MLLLSKNADVVSLFDGICSLHSFNYPSLASAKKEIRIESIRYCFDALSLCTYSHNLTREHIKELGLLLDNYYSKFNREKQKERTERAVLFHYIEYGHPEYREYTIEKAVRPDFILCGASKRIGIEVVRLTTPKDQVLKSIATDSYGRGYSIEETKENAIKKHGGKAKVYKYFSINGSNVIATDIIDVNEQKKVFAELIVDKYRKYASMLHSFDKFIILCDAQQCISINAKEDVHDVLECVGQLIPAITGLSVVLLYEANNETMVYEAKL